MTDPLTIAREVLETAHEDETVTVCTIPDNKAAALARAVIDLITERGALVEQLERLAVELECEASLPGHLRATGGFDRAHVAARIRTALNGDDR